MSQQALDLRRSIQIVRRHKLLVGVVAVFGLLLGIAYAVLNPPRLTSTALVAFLRSVPSVSTEVYIATSDPVLSTASHSVSPATSISELRGEVQARSLTPFLLSISAAGKTPAQAQATANAVANSFIAYVGAKTTSIGHVPAEIFQPPAPGSGSSPRRKQIIFGIIGLLGGALIGAVISLAVGRHDRRLRERDEIARSIGVPVLASVPVGHPSGAAGWRKLIEDYEPGAVDAWRLHRVLQQLGIARDNLPEGAFNNGHGGRGSAFTVLSLSSDRGALALGPQLAAFAASSGIPTALVIGPQQDTNVTATLRTACAMQSPVSSKRPRELQLAVADDSNTGWELGAALTVVVAVVDGRDPQMPDTMRTAATVLGVSAGAATAEQLARVAVSADADGREITGIVVADPDPADTTTGHVPQVGRPRRRRIPARVVGITTEMRR